MDVTTAARRHRQALLDGQAEAAKLLADAYRPVIKGLLRDARTLLRTTDRLRKAGVAVPERDLVRLASYQRALTQYTGGLERLAPVVAGVTDRLAVDASRQARTDAAELLSTFTPDEAPTAATHAFQHIVAATDRGGLERLLRARAGENADKCAAVLREAVAREWKPTRTARALETAAGGNFTNALMVARTEQMRAYREGVRQTFIADPTVNRWEWHARCNARCCGMCWANHGRVFRTNQVMATHPSCMCTMLPVRVGEKPDRPTGVELFEAASPKLQAAVLSPSKLAAYRDGALTLPDLVSRKRSRAWGMTGTERSLTDVLGPAAAAPYIAAARRRT